MKIIAESGGTKAVWILHNKEGKSLRQIETLGIRPKMTSNEKIRAILLEVQSQLNKNEILEIAIYCSGCHNRANAIFLKSEIQKVFGDATKIEVYSDLVIAALAALGKNKGVVGILGTGSVAFVWDGCEVQQIFGGKGFPGGDEGSGADLGKHLLQYCISNDGELTQRLKAEIGNFEQFSQQAYDSDAPARKFADLTYFIYKNRDKKEMKNIIFQSFSNYFSMLDKMNCKNRTIALVGSIAFLFQKEITSVSRKYGWKIKKIVRSPIDEIISKN